jgi:hypothetical protein
MNVLSPHYQNLSAKYTYNMLLGIYQYPYQWVSQITYLRV